MYPRNPLTSLLHRVRNRVWMQALIDNVSMGIATGACLLFAGSLLLMPLGTMPSAAWLIPALVPAMLLLMFALLYRRPSLPSAARIADRWFHGHELLTSALPLTSPGYPTRLASENLVVARANALCAEWKTRLPLRQPYRIPAYNLVSLLLVVASLFLLTLPASRTSQQETLVAELPRLSGDRATPVAPGPDTSFRQQLQDVLHTGKSTDPASAATGPVTALAPAGDSQPVQHSIQATDGNGIPARTGPAATGQPVATPDAQADAHANTTGDPGGSTGADAAAWTGSSGDTPATVHPADIRHLPRTATRIMEFPRTPANPATAKHGSTRGGILDNSTDITIDAGRKGITPPAAVRSILPEYSGLGPAHRDLAASYFKRMNTQ